MTMQTVSYRVVDLDQIDHALIEHRSTSYCFSLQAQEEQQATLIHHATLGIARPGEHILHAHKVDVPCTQAWGKCRVLILEGGGDDGAA